MCRLLSLMLTRLHCQCLCQQSSLASFSKTPQVLSVIRPFSVGKHHGNSAGKSLNLSYCNKHIWKKRLYTHTAAARVPHQCWAIDVSPMSSGPTGQNWAVIKADTQVELLLSATRSQLRERPQVLWNTVYRKEALKKSLSGCRSVVASLELVSHRWLEDAGITFGFQVSGLCKEPDDPMKVGVISFHFFLSAFKLSSGPFVMGCVLRWFQH